LSPNPPLDPTRLTEQLNPDATSLLPHPVPLDQATPRDPCRIGSMLNPTLDNPTHLAQLTLRLSFPLPSPQAWTEAKMKLFPQKSKLTRNQNRIWKRTLKDLRLNFKDYVVLKFDLSLQIHLFIIPCFYF
jgi:hypothetical protein